MNAPLPVPVTLDNLGEVADAAVKTAATTTKKARKLQRAALPMAASVLKAAGVLAWRMAPVVVKNVVKAQQRRTRRARNQRRNLVIATGATVAAVALLARWQLQRLFTEEPKHVIEMKKGRFEIRRYPSIRVAETTIANAGWDVALDRGFRRLASFIFGNNNTHATLPMTTPVLGTGDDNGYRLSFVLPEGIAAPEPTDDRVEVTTRPPARIAVLRFNGRHSAETIESHKSELLQALLANDLKHRGEVSFAGYDPPSTLPFLRRNELWVELE